MRQTRIFYGWYVVAAVLLITTATSGLSFYNLSVLLAAFTDDGRFPVSIASAGTAIFFVASGVGGMISGRIVDRLDVRAVVAGAAFVGALTLAMAGHVASVWHLLAFHLVLGLSHGGASLVPLTTLVARWFEAKRALALSIATSGLSLGGILVTPASAHFVREAGLAAAAPFLGLALFLGVVPVAVLVLRSSPQSMGLAPDGAAVGTASAALPPRPPEEIAALFRTRAFVGISAAYLIGLGAQVGAIAHVFRIGSTQAGFEAGAMAVSTMAACSMIGRLIGGYLLLKIAPLRFALAVLALQAVALVLFSAASTHITIVACAALFGLSLGNSLIMHPLLLAERFGTRDIGRIYALSQMIAVLGMAGGPALIGLLYDASGGYKVPMLSVAACTVLAMATLAWGMGERERATNKCEP